MCLFSKNLRMRIFFGFGFVLGKVRDRLKDLVF